MARWFSEKEQDVMSHIPTSIPSHKPAAIATLALTRLWPLDGNLRLLPLAALWDGKQYFGQKCQHVMVILSAKALTASF
jgi:hypothetical protein